MVALNFTRRAVNLNVGVPLATDAEAVAGTNAAKAVTPKALDAAFDARVGTGSGDIAAIQADVNTRALASTPITRGGLLTGTGETLGGALTFTVTAATEAQAQAGTATTVAMTPKRTEQFFEYRTTSFSRTFLTSADSEAAARTAIGAAALSTALVAAGLAVASGTLGSAPTITVTEASNAQAQAGTASDVVMTPRRTKTYVDQRIVEVAGQDDAAVAALDALKANVDLANVADADFGAKAATGRYGARARSVASRSGDRIDLRDYSATPGADEINEAISDAYADGRSEIYIDPELDAIEADSTIYMRKGVVLSGAPSRQAIAQSYGTVAAEAVAAGQTVIRAASGLAGPVIAFDYSITPAAERPYGAALQHLVIECEDQASGAGVEWIAGGASEGPFGNGEFSDVSQAWHVNVRNAAAQAFLIGEDVNRIVLHYCQGMFAGRHALQIENCSDIWVFGFSGNESKGGLLNKGQLALISYSAFFNSRYDASVAYSGNGVTDLGQFNRYDYVEGDNSECHGLEIQAGSFANARRSLRFNTCLFKGNGGLADNTYDDIHIGAYNGDGLGAIDFVGLQLSVLGNTYNPTYKPRNGLHLEAAASLGIGLYGGGMPTANVHTPLNTYAQQSIRGEDFLIGNNRVSATPFTFSAWTGDSSPNVARCFASYETANVAAANLYGFTGGRTGQRVRVRIMDANTGVKFSAASGSNLYGNGGTNLTAGSSLVGTLLTFRCLDGTKWVAESVEQTGGRS